MSCGKGGRGQPRFPGRLERPISGNSMDTHFLASDVTGTPGFSAEPWYNPDGDCLVCRIANEAIVADRIDGVLTIYRSAIDDRPIGFQLKGIRSLLSRYGADLLAIQCTTDQAGANEQLVSVRAMLLVAYERGPQSIGRRQAYACALDVPNASPYFSRNELMFV